MDTSKNEPRDCAVVAVCRGMSTAWLAWQISGGTSKRVIMSLELSHLGRRLSDLDALREGFPILRSCPHPTHDKESQQAAIDRFNLRTGERSAGARSEALYRTG